MINYPVDVQNTRWTIIQISTGQIIDRNRVWPVANGSPIQNADADYVYLLQGESSRPEYDARLFTMQGVETVDVSANQINKSWIAEKRSMAEQVQAAENVEAERAQYIVSLEREVIETRLVLGAMLTSHVDNQALPPKAQALTDQYKDEAIQLWQNRDRLDQIKEDIAADIEPDLDDGWA
jgi:hypothetical protein